MHVLLLLALASAVTKTALHRQVVQFPAIVQVRSGDSVTMSCRLDGVKAYCYTVAWMKVNPDGGSLVISKNVAGSLSKQIHLESTECPVVIHNTTAEDSGMYYCTVTDRQKIYTGNGTSVLVQAHSSAAPSVEVLKLSSSSTFGSAVPVQCVVRGAVPSQVDLYWMIGFRRERAQTDTVRAKGEVFTVSWMLMKSEDCKGEKECACVVEHEGQTITKTLNDPRDSCLAAIGLHRALALSASLLLFITAVTAASCGTTEDSSSSTR